MIHRRARHDLSEPPGLGPPLDLNAVYYIYICACVCIYIFHILGIAIGHIYYYLEDVFPEQRGGFKILHTPKIL